MDLRTYIDLSSSDEQWFRDGIACASPFNFSDSFFEPTISADNVVTSMISTYLVNSRDPIITPQENYTVMMRLTLMA